jgi:hypothetical protein
MESAMRDVATVSGYGLGTAEREHGRVLRGAVVRRLLTGLLLAVAAGLVFFAFSTSEDEAVPAARDSAIRRVFPDDGTVSIRQDQIGIELAFGYTGVLQIDRTEIPDDQVDRIAGINRLSFTPGAGKEITALSPGRHCATALFWPSGRSRDDARRHSWCFTAA